MPTSRFDRMLPWTGVLIGIAFAFDGYLETGPDTPDDPARLTWLATHQAIGIAAAIASAVLSLLMFFFAAAVRRALLARDHVTGSYAAVAYGGMIALAAGASADAALQLGALDAASRGHGDVVLTLGYLSEFSWIPWIVASAAMFLGLGIGALVTDALPRWLAVVTLVLGGLCLLGLPGIVVYLVSPLWFAATGIALARRSRPRQEAPNAIAAPVAHPV